MTVEETVSGVNVIAVVKGRERFIVLYSDEHRLDALRTLMRWASDPELSFTWYDATVASNKMKERHT